MDKFGVKHKDIEEIMGDWFIDEDMIVKQGERYVPTKHLKDPCIVQNTMICKIHGEETNTHLRMEWFLIAYTMSKTRRSLTGPIF